VSYGPLWLFEAPFHRAVLDQLCLLTCRPPLSRLAVVHATCREQVYASSRQRLWHISFSCRWHILWLQVLSFVARRVCMAQVHCHLHAVHRCTPCCARNLLTQNTMLQPVCGSPSERLWHITLQARRSRPSQADRQQGTTGAPCRCDTHMYKSP
jgi:hypothetical protein